MRDSPPPSWYEPPDGWFGDAPEEEEDDYREFGSGEERLQREIERSKQG